MKNMKNIQKNTKKYIPLLLIAVFAVIFAASCGGDLGPLDSTTAFNVPAHNSTLVVSNIRVRGFTLSWEDLPGRGHYYAIAASRSGGVDTYEEARENGHVILGFTPAEELNGTFRVTGLLAGQQYDIRLFVRRANTRAAEFLSAGATLPFLDGVELMEVWFDGEPANLVNRREDIFTKAIVPTIASLMGEDDEENDTEIQTEFTVTYRMAARTTLFGPDGEPMPEEFTLRSGEQIMVTAVHDRTNTARDYIIAVSYIDNGIPIMILETENMRPLIVRREYVGARMMLLDSRTNPNRAYRHGLFEQEPVEMIIRNRGSLALHRPKHSFIIRTCPDVYDPFYGRTTGARELFGYPDPTRIPILDMHAGEDWVLLANFTDKTLMRNFIAHELFRDMGAIFSPQFRFVDLVFNGQYVGTYMIGERVKIDPGRFELPQIRAEDRIRINARGREVLRPASTPEELTGSYVLELKSTSSFQSHEIIFETSRIRWNTGSYFRIRQPGPDNLTVEAYNYISTFVNNAEDALFSDDFTCPQTGYRAFLDVATFIDWYIVNELFRRIDSDFTDNIYFYKPRDGLLSMGPVWDFETAGGNHINAHSPEGWHVRNAVWFRRLFEDPAFVQEFTDRWNFVKANHFDRMFDLIDNTAERLEFTQQMNFARWPILGINVWPNPPGASGRSTFQSEVDHLRNWLTARIEWMDNEINGHNEE